MRSTTGWRADAAGTLRRAALSRRELRADDVAVRVDYCGVCHSDLHALRSHASGPGRALVPGHEFTGVVTAVGPEVTAFAPGDPVAVGNIVDSCGECAMCRAGQENFCRSFPTLTYGGADRVDGTTTLGGWSREYVVRDRFAYRLPDVWTRPRRRRCSVPGSRCGSRSRHSASAPAAAWPWSGSVASGTSP